MFKLVVVALLSIVIGASASAGPNAQLVRSVELGLAKYGLQAEVSSFDTHTVARLYMTLYSRERSGRKVLHLKTILRKAKRKQPEAR
jgi:hypothetical protein